MVSIGEPDNQLFAKLKKYGIPEPQFEHLKLPPSIKGRYVMFDNGAAIVRLKEYSRNPKNLSVLQHEIFHVVMNLMGRIGAKFELGVSEETYAYIIQYLTKEIYTKAFS